MASSLSRAILEAQKGKWEPGGGVPWQQHLQIPTCCFLQCWPWPQAAFHLLAWLLVWVLTGLGADAISVQPTQAF